MEEDSRPKKEEEVKKEFSEENEEYFFLQEVIKDERGRWRILKKQWIRLVAWGLAFGVVAGLGFAWTNRLTSSGIKKVTIPKEKDVSPQENPKENSPDSYLQMQQELGDIAQKVRDSVVEIRIPASRENWEEEQTACGITGIVIADNGKEILIWGEAVGAEEGRKLQAVFCDGRKEPVVLKKKDDSLGMGIYSVSVDCLRSSTVKHLKVAELGSSNFIQLGETVLAVGNPLGNAESMGVGVIMSKDGCVSRMDGCYRVLQTDIAAGEEGSGVLVNLKGEIIGIIDQSVAPADNRLVAGYGISDLKRTMEILSNDREVPCLGIRGLEVPEEIQEQGIPQGVYIKEILPDSPAMEAGLQKGDILTEMGGRKVTTLAEYRRYLLDLKIGEKIRLKGLRQGTEGYVDIAFDVTVEKHP